MALQTISGDLPRAFQDEQLIDAQEAARRLGLSPSWLAKARMTGAGPAFVKCGRRVLYKPSDLWTWLEAHRRRSTSDADEGNSNG